MTPGILIPVGLIVVVLPLLLAGARRRWRTGSNTTDDDPVERATSRLTSGSLRSLPTPPWRVVYEISAERLGGVTHVAIGPGGTFGIISFPDQLPPPPSEAPDAHTIAAAAIERGELDDALRTVGLESARLVRVYWGAAPDPSTPAYSPVVGVTALAGQMLVEWLGQQDADTQSPAQIDLAWQTISTTIGRPDPLG